MYSIFFTIINSYNRSILLLYTVYTKRLLNQGSTVENQQSFPNCGSKSFLNHGTIIDQKGSSIMERSQIKKVPQSWIKKIPQSWIKKVYQSKNLYIKSFSIKKPLHVCESFTQAQRNYCHHKNTCLSCLTTNQLKTPRKLN